MLTGRWAGNGDGGRREPTIAPLQGVGGFDWEELGDEFIDMLQKAARNQLEAGSFSTHIAVENGWDYVFRVERTGLNSHLLLRPEPDELRVAVALQPDAGDDDVGLWTDVVREALALLQRPRLPWQWAAIIAPTGTSTDPGPSLSGTTTIGGMTLRPSDRAIRRSPRPVPWEPILPIANSWPCIVEGASPVFELHENSRAQLEARRRLHRLCALLTVVFDGVPWQLERGPDSQPPGLLEVPGSLSDPDAPQFPFTKREVDTPDWFGLAWQVLGENTDLDSALSLLYEGARMRTSSPSVALVALVGCIETLAAGRREHCETCNQVTGSTRRFKEAVAEVLPEDEVAELAHLYSMRSRTVHSARLYGFEGNFNVTSLDHFIPIHGPLDFSLRLTHQAQQAAVLLLVRRVAEAAGRL